MASVPCSERGVATRFRPGVSPNPGGRPSKLAVALRGLQPLRQLGVLDSELVALAEANVAGSTLCTAIALDLIDRRLRNLRHPGVLEEAIS